MKSASQVQKTEKHFYGSSSINVSENDNDNDNIYIRALLVFWTGYFIFFVARAIITNGIGELQSVPRRLISTAVGAGLSWIMYRAGHRVESKSIIKRSFWLFTASTVLSCLFSGFNTIEFIVLQPLFGESCNKEICNSPFLFGFFVEYAFNFTFVFAAWGMLCLWMQSQRRIASAEMRASKAREDARAAENTALRYQLNPHFLFNCLNSLSTLVGRKDGSEAREMIAELGAFIRYGLAGDLVADVTVSEEVDMQLRYLALERRRFPHRIRVIADVAEGVKMALVPALILQPLVENAVKHGVATTRARVTITIRAVAIDLETILLQVENFAEAPRGLRGSSIATSGFGLGLQNVADRLAVRYGEGATLSYHASSDQIFRSEIRLPITFE